MKEGCEKLSPHITPGGSAISIRDGWVRFLFPRPNRPLKPKHFPGVVYLLMPPLVPSAGGGDADGGESGGGESDLSATFAHDDGSSSLEANKRGGAGSALLVVIVLLNAFLGNVLVSLLAPFLPEQLAKMNVSQIYSGILFTIFPVAVVISAPLMTSVSNRIGRPTLAVIGIATQGLASVLFGYSVAITASSTQALVVMILSRFTCGVGAGAANLAVFSAAADTFEHSLASVMAAVEVLIGVGFAAGPVVGQMLYLAGGFSLPFLVLGLITAVAAPAAAWLPSQQQNTEQTHGQDEQENGSSAPKRSALTTPLVLSGGVLLLGTAIFGFVEPILALHLTEDDGVSQKHVAYYFLAINIPYLLAAPLVGHVADRVGHARVLFFGSAACGATLIMMGPIGMRAFFVSSPSAKARADAILLSVMGLWQALSLIPALPAMKSGAAASGSEAVVALFNGFQQTGLALGPIAGSLMTHMFGGYRSAVELLGIIVVGYTVICLVISTLCLQRSEEMKLGDEESTTTPLLTRDDDYDVDDGNVAGRGLSEPMEAPTTTTPITATAASPSSFAATRVGSFRGAASPLTSGALVSRLYSNNNNTDERN